MSEVSKVFESLSTMFNPAGVKQPRTFYFSLGDDEKWTVAYDKQKCTITPGKPDQDADCFFKASEKMFLDVWNGKHTPGPMDFMTGKIKSNNPMLLKEFVDAFNRD
jgi:putative sterol carrier protein